MEVLNIGKKIKEQRLLKEWSQEDLARASSIPLTTITKIETGVIKNPSIQKIAKIAGAFGMTIDELIKN